MRRISLLAWLLVFFLIPGPAGAVDTNVVVRAKAKDAMFIGTSMGGARVVIRDAESGAVIASGVTAGGTGSRQVIMADRVPRRGRLADEGTAMFAATLDVVEPHLVVIEVSAPQGQRQSRISASTQVWLIPGKHLDGDGIVVEIPGFAVDVLSPQAAESIVLDGPVNTIPIKANVVMMCGCPVKPGGTWDASNYEVGALIKHNGEPVGAVPLAFTGKTSTFEGEIQVTEPGLYEFQVYAYDPSRSNTGLDRVVVKVIP